MTASDLTKDIELMNLRDLIEQNTVTMLSMLVTEADKKKLPIELNHEAMLKFLGDYEQVRDREKRLMAEGYPEKHLNRGTQLVYGRLI